MKHDKFGYIRLRTFSVDDEWAFLSEFIRLAALVPQNGLIIDVRGNGGGLILAGELILQTLTPARSRRNVFNSSMGQRPVH